MRPNKRYRWSADKQRFFSLEDRTGWLSGCFMLERGHPATDFASGQAEGMEPKGEDTNKLSGWSTNYYRLPEGASELQHLIEHRNMNFSMGNIFKATYRYGEKDGTSPAYDLEKIMRFAFFELKRIGAPIPKQLVDDMRDYHEKGPDKTCV